MSGVIVLVGYFSISWLFAISLHKNSYIAKSYNPISIIFFCLPPLVVGFYFIGLKPFSAGGDTINYLSAFRRIGDPLKATADAGYGSEILFWPMQATIKLFFDERGWLVVNYILVSALNYYAYKKITDQTKFSPLIFSLAILTYYVAFSGNAMRQVYAIPLGVIAFHYSYRKEYFKFLIYISLAIMFHWSSVIFLISPILNRIPNRGFYLFFLPLAALISSKLITPVTVFAINIAGFNWLLVKTDAYIFGGTVSHISAIWHTLTFWYCVLIYILLLFFRVYKIEGMDKVSKYFLLFISIMFFSIEKTDIADRYMALFLFLSPIVIVATISRMKMTEPWRNIVFLVSFFVIGGFVYTSGSIVKALGISQ